MDQRLEGMMDCIKKAFVEGCERGLKFEKMRYGIIVEMKRLGLNAAEIKDKMEEWNNRCEKVLGPSDLESQIFKFVDWVFKKKDAKIGCTSMTACGYCLGKEKCQYYIKKYVLNRKLTENTSRDLSKISGFLNERYPGHVGRELIMILQVLSDYQYEKATGEIILISFRKICSLLRDKFHWNPQPMEVKRRVWTLIREEIIETAIQGKPGTFYHLANGYRFLPWNEANNPNPLQRTLTHMCNTTIEGRE